jgi:hypothetical protein
MCASILRSKTSWRLPVISPLLQTHLHEHLCVRHAKLSSKWSLLWLSTFQTNTAPHQSISLLQTRYPSCCANTYTPSMAQSHRTCIKYLRVTWQNISKIFMVEDGHTCVRAAQAPRWFKCIRPDHPAQGGVMLCTVQCRPAAACARKKTPRVHSKETRQDKTSTPRACLGEATPSRPVRSSSFRPAPSRRPDDQGRHKDYTGLDGPPQGGWEGEKQSVEALGRTAPGAQPQSLNVMGLWLCGLLLCHDCKCLAGHSSCKVKGQTKTRH